MMDMKNRGVRLRFISEITKDNLSYCEELEKIGEIRHLDEVKGFLELLTGNYIMLVQPIIKQPPPPQLIVSTVRAFVDQQQYFFDMLWKKAVPIQRRIREIKEGLTREYVEMIQDFEETLSLVSKVVSSATKEIQILFSHTDMIKQYEQRKILGMLRRKADDGIAVRILIGTGIPAEGRIINLSDLFRNMELRYLERSIRTRLSMVIVDKEISLTIEEKENEGAIGFATYSNSKPTVQSYASIFESLWKQVELYEKVKLHDTLQKDFVNIAAHELRNPIQPILVLSESLKTRVIDSEGVKMVDIINRSALRLQQLSEDILDITRIETHSLRINKSQFDLNNLIRKITNDFSKRITNDSNIRLKTNFTNDRLLVQADIERITQVINNLINNALKFTTKGIITIGTESKMDKEQLVEKQTHNRKMAMVYVKDTGLGIDSEILPRLFEKFVTKSSGGTGLGLYFKEHSSRS
jgi:signal transduction histidine kinase